MRNHNKDENILTRKSSKPELKVQKSLSDITKSLTNKQKDDKNETFEETETQLENVEEECCQDEKLETPSSLDIVPDRVIKPTSKNCYRLVILGASKVGKTSIVSRFLNNKYEESYTPTIEDFHRKLYRIRGDVYQLDILDTSGNHPFPAMRKLSFLTGDLFMLVFSVDNHESWKEVIRLREQILETKSCAAAQSSAHSTNARKKTINPRVPMIIAANKIDQENRCVALDTVKELITPLSCCGFVETSAKKNYNVDTLFYELFVLANLPMEMSPALHKKICPGPLALNILKGGSRAARTGVVCPGMSGFSHRGLSLRRRLSEAYGVVSPNVRRPSIRTDFLIISAKTSLELTETKRYREKRKREVNCVIQ